MHTKQPPYEPKTQAHSGTVRNPAVTETQLLIGFISNLFPNRYSAHPSFDRQVQQPLSLWPLPHSTMGFVFPPTTLQNRKGKQKGKKKKKKKKKKVGALPANRQFRGIPGGYGSR